MLIRIVKMEFRPAEVDAFQKVFNASCQHIRAFEGCEHLALLQDQNHPNIFFTYSHWKHADHLERYRHSALFKSVWAKTKPLFAQPAEAWSVGERKLLP